MIKRQIALDTETTGRLEKDGTPGLHKIIEVGCVEIIDRKVTGRVFHKYINPQRDSDAEAEQVHGLSTEFLKDKPLFKEIALELRDFLYGAELLIHNAKFDVAFLDKEFADAGLNFKTKDIATITDTLVTAREYNPTGQLNLNRLCKQYGVSSDLVKARDSYHGALLDAQLLAEVYLAMTGGQENLFKDNNTSVKSFIVSNERWHRDNAKKLPIMQVEPQIKALHISNMIELSQGKKFKQQEDESYLSGCNWSSDFDMEYLEKGKEEDKKAYKKRIEAQKEAMLDKLLTSDERKLLEQYIDDDKKAYLEWDKKVRGE